MDGTAASSSRLSLLLALPTSWRTVVQKRMGFSNVTRIAGGALVASVILLALLPSYARLPSSRGASVVIHHSPESQERVAMAVQGTLKRFAPWNTAIQLVRQADLFYLAYDKNASCNGEQTGQRPHHNDVYSATCVYAPVTWTRGRNRLAQEILKHEERWQMKYKYWLFLDEDTINVKCAWCAQGPERSACCYDVLTRFLTRPSVQYASVAPTQGFGENQPSQPHWMRYDDCVDAMMHAFHRDAVPLFLPYWDNFEDRGWWASQQLLFYVAHACFPRDSNMRVGGYDMSEGNQHAEYPRGVVGVEDIRNLFQKDIPELLHGVMIRNGELKDIRDGSCEHATTWFHPSLVNSSSGGWRDNAAFQLCQTFLAHRWESLVQAATGVAS